jgi:hypothetical protein
VSTLKATPVARDRVQEYKHRIGDSDLQRERFALQRRVSQLKDRLFADYPAVFCGGFRGMRLLATDIHRQIEDATGADAGAIDSFLHQWCNQDAYLRATLNAPERVNLDGTSAGKPQVAHKVHAIKSLQQAGK